MINLITAYRIPFLQRINLSSFLGDDVERQESQVMGGLFSKYMF